LGAHLDPLADKILLISAYVTLAIFNLIPSWLAVLTISRDVLILLGVLVLYLNRYPVRMKPSILSKATTCMQVVTILIALSNGYLDIQFLKVYSVWVTASLTVASGLKYMREGLIMLSQGVNGNFA